MTFSYAGVQYADYASFQSANLPPTFQGGTMGTPNNAGGSSGDETMYLIGGGLLVLTIGVVLFT
jgi:hypothetical protein